MKENKFHLMLSDKLGKKESRADLFASVASPGLLFLISFFYFLWLGNGIFFLQEKKSLFIFSVEYLQKFLVKPGGLLEYAGNFLTQGYFSNTYGSLVNSLFLLLFYALFIRINRLLSEDNSFSLVIVLMPSCQLLLMQIHEDHFIHYTIGYLLTAFCFLTLISETKRLYLIPVLFSLLFYLTGTFAFLFSLIFISYCLAFKKGIQRYLLPVILLITAFVTYVVFEEVLFLQPPDRLLSYPLNIFDFTTQNRGELILWGYMILFPLIVKINAKIKTNEGFSLLPKLSLLILFFLTLFILGIRYDPERKNDLQIEEYFIEQNWDAVIEQHEKIPSKNFIGQYYYNLSLTWKGQLCDRMFFGNQDYGIKSLTLPRNRDNLGRSSYFYYATGMINEAHHLAYESMVIDGYCPENLKMLIRTDIINGNYKSAERFINILKKTLHYRKWTEKFEKMLFKPEIVYSDPELCDKIKLQPGKDFFIRPDDKENIDFLLVANPDNKKAFEYKMAFLLLEKDYKAVMYQVKKMKDMKYTRIPRHIEESMMVFIDHKYELPYLGDFKVSFECEDRFSQFLKDLRINNTEHKTEMEKYLKTKWGNTFWYYLELR